MEKYDTAGELEEIIVIGKFGDGCRQIITTPETKKIILEVLSYPDNIVKVDAEILEGVDIVKKQ
jgi:hypothetical protein